MSIEDLTQAENATLRAINAVAGGCFRDLVPDLRAVLETIQKRRAGELIREAKAILELFIDDDRFDPELSVMLDEVAELEERYLG